MAATLAPSRRPRTVPKRAWWAYTVALREARTPDAMADVLRSVGV